jgi:hypothetical protein
VKVQIDFPVTVGFDHWSAACDFAAQLSQAIGRRVFELELYVDEDCGLYEFEFHVDEEEYADRHDELYPEVGEL